MTKRNLLTLCLMAAALAPICEGGQTVTYPVEVVFRDAPGDRIRSDGLGPYVDGVDKVRAEITDRGRLSLFACATSAKDKIRCPGPRGMVLDFGDLATDVLGTAAEPGPTSAGLPFVSGSVDSLYVGVNLVDANGDHLADGLLGMTDEVGEHMAAGLKGNFLDQDGNFYTIRLSPKVTTDSNWVLVTYLGGQIPCDETTPCASWTVEAWTGPFTGAPMCCPTYDLYDIGTLLSDNTNDEGDYHLPFLMTITALPQSSGGGSGGGHGKRGNGK